MATYDKVEVQLTSGSHFYFKATQYKPNPQRTGSIVNTFNVLDLTIGPIIETFRYTFRVKLDSTSGSEGNYDDLYNILQLSNPNEDPSPRFIFTDHFGTVWKSAWFKPGQIDVNPLTTQLEGPNAYMLVTLDVVCQAYEFPEHMDFSDADYSINYILWF